MTLVNNSMQNIYGWSADVTENASMCKAAREQGFKIGLETRLHVAHRKSVYLAFGWETDPFAWPKIVVPTRVNLKPPSSTVKRDVMVAQSSITRDSARTA